MPRARARSAPCDSYECMQVSSLSARELLSHRIRDTRKRYKRFLTRLQGGLFPATPVALYVGFLAVTDDVS